MRGNVIELAVGVVIGAAFTAVVTAFSDAIINPLLAALGGVDYSGLGFFVREGNEATFAAHGDPRPARRPEPEQRAEAAELVRP